MKAVCGLDVHKDSVYLCILSEFGELIEKVFGVLTYQLEEFIQQSLGIRRNSFNQPQAYSTYPFNFF